MHKHKYYSGAKGQFIQNRMAGGRTNKQARQDWKKSDEKKIYPQNEPQDGNFDPIDRSHNSPMRDWADTAEDH